MLSSQAAQYQEPDKCFCECVCACFCASLCSATAVVLVLFECAWTSFRRHQVRYHILVKLPQRIDKVRTRHRTLGLLAQLQGVQGCFWVTVPVCASACHCTRLVFDDDVYEYVAHSATFRIENTLPLTLSRCHTPLSHRETPINSRLVSRALSHALEKRDRTCSSALQKNTSPQRFLTWFTTSSSLVFISPWPKYFASLFYCPPLLPRLNFLDRQQLEAPARPQSQRGGLCCFFFDSVTLLLTSTVRLCPTATTVGRTSTMDSYK